MGILLALGAALGWAGLDASRKVLVRDLAPTVLVVWLMVGQALPFLVWSLAVGRWPEPGYAAPGLACLGLNVLANVAFVHAVKVSPLSLTIPYLSFTPVFTTLVGVPLLGEIPAPVQLGGIGAVVIGALLLHGGGAKEGAGWLAPFRAFARERGSVLMTGVALLWSITAALDKVALAHAPVPVHALVQTGGVGALLLLLLAAQRRLPELRQVRRRPGAYALAVVFATAAVALGLLAIQLVLVALVETIKRAVGMTMSVVVGRALFGESVTAAKLVAVALMAAGTAAIVLSP